MKRSHRPPLIAAFLLTALAADAQAELLAGLRDSDRHLIFFDGDVPETIVRDVVVGVPDGTTPVGLDYRPADGKLYLVGYASGQCTLYTVDPETGAATASGAAFACALPLEADFDPAGGDLRVFAAGEHYRVAPGSGGRTDASAPAYAGGDERAGLPASVAAAGYSSGSEQTLFAVEENEDVLARVGAAGGGVSSADGAQLSSIGELGLNVVGAAFDISSATGRGYLFTYFSPDTSENGALYSVSLDTGSTGFLGKVGAGDLDLAGMTVIPEGGPTEPRSGGGGGGGPAVPLTLAALAVLWIAGRRLRPRAPQ